MSHKNTMKRDIHFPEENVSVLVVPKSYPDGYTIDWHSHDYSQLVYACSGVMVVATMENMWVIPPQRAVWVPAGILHKVAMYGHAEMRNVYLQSNSDHQLLENSAVVSISPLLGEIIAYMASSRYEQSGSDEKERLVAVMLDQLRIADQVSLYLPLAKDRRLASVCEYLLAQPADTQSLTDWANRVNISSRTLSRLFRQEFGMSFVEYRNQVRLFEALKQLAKGAPVTTVALDVGFISVSAFSRLFKRYFGKPPSHYFSEINFVQP